MKDFFNRKDEFEYVLSLFLGDGVLKHNYLKRLDGVSFLGTLDYVFDVPKEFRSTRYDHVLGVAYLTLRYCSKLMIPEPETFILVLAALIHDIGHGPLAHSIEFLQVLRDSGTHHSNLKITKVEAFLRDCYGGVPKALQNYNFSKFVKKLPSVIVDEKPDSDFNKFVECVTFAIDGSNRLQNANIRKMFNNPFCPDTFEGINRACWSLRNALGLKYFDPEKLIDEVSFYGEPLIVESNQEPSDNHVILKFHKLMKKLYEDVIDTPWNRAAEAMLTRAADHVYLHQKKIEYSNLKDSQLIRKLKSDEFSFRLWSKIEGGKQMLFVPLSLTDRRSYLAAVNKYHKEHKYKARDFRSALREAELFISERLCIPEKELVIMYMFITLSWKRSNIFFEPAGNNAWKICWHPSEGTPAKNPIYEVYVPRNG